MKLTEMFPSRWAKADDVPEDGVVVTIKKVSIEKIGEEQEAKPIVQFEDFDKELVLNRTNGESIVQITGETDSRNWVGCQIKLYRTPVPLGAKTVPAIRIKAPDRVKPAQRRTSTRPAAQAMSMKDTAEFGSPY